MPTTNYSITALELLGHFQEFLGQFEASPPVRPGPSVPFKWPPKYDNHIRADEWTRRTAVATPDEEVEVRWAERGPTIIGQIEKYRVTAEGKSEQDVVGKLLKGVKPLFDRQREIGWLVGHGGRFMGSFSELSPVGLVRCLYAVDRDIAHEAATQIETHATQAVFAPTLISILEDNAHPQRRSAQWAVLDLLEDVWAFFPDPDGQQVAIDAIQALMWDASDDYARTIYKAGVVLGGHICSKPAAESLLSCFEAPSKFGRRAAYHASFHLAEWMPELRPRIVEALRVRSREDNDFVLACYCADMANDVQSGGVDHVGDPVFPEDTP